MWFQLQQSLHFVNLQHVCICKVTLSVSKCSEVIMSLKCGKVQVIQLKRLRNYSECTQLLSACGCEGGVPLMESLSSGGASIQEAAWLLRDAGRSGGGPEQLQHRVQRGERSLESRRQWRGRAGGGGGGVTQLTPSSSLTLIKTNGQVYTYPDGKAGMGQSQPDSLGLSLCLWTKITN